jgi:muramoyltetrapeptide carboxypeptidase
MKAPALRPGDTIGVIAPSWCGPATFPHRVAQGVAYLESVGYRVVVAPHAYGCRGYVSGTPEERVADIHGLVADPRVRVIISAIGGNHSCQLLPLLDWDLICRHPKIFIGYSDMTVLTLAIHARTGLVTFNGPHLMTDFGEYPVPYPYTLDYWQRALCQAVPMGAIVPSVAWTEEVQDWAAQDDVKRPRVLQPSRGWTWLKGGRAEGRLVGGCLESMEHLRGTPYWPNMDGAIHFVETSEEAPGPDWVDAALQDYDNMGVLGRLRGLLVGRPMRYTDAQKEQLRAVILERTACYDFPIVTDMDFGHTAPQVTLPIGCQARIDVAEERIVVTEAAVSDVATANSKH